MTTTPVSNAMERLSTRYIVGDVLDVLRSLPDASVDLVMSSPPFLALRSYLPADHPDKAKEIGAEKTPGEFIDTLLDVTEECRRVLTPHGSFVFELGDTYSGSGGAGGDYLEGGIREGQNAFDGAARRARDPLSGRYPDRDLTPGQKHNGKGSDGWPMDKSLTGIPTLFTWSLAYGRNLLTGRPIPQWRIRNVIVWARPNPPVGALADKFRPATSYLTVATMARDRWFDMDAVRTPHTVDPKGIRKVGTALASKGISGGDSGNPEKDRMLGNPAGAPLLDYWEITTQPYKGSHYATFPEELPMRVILSMCPERVCTTCGEPSRRIVQPTEWNHAAHPMESEGVNAGGLGTHGDRRADRVTLGWTDCGHGTWRPGIVLDPFAGSGTTLRMAMGNGRSSIGIDIDERNADLASDRIGPLYLEVERPRAAV